MIYKIKCSICEKNVNKIDTFIPSVCLMEYGKRAHKICSECWWDSEIGFARECASHKCPGCKKGLPLTPFKKDYVFIDLTNE